MLTSDLIHPPLIGALAAAGHGTRILIADGNFPYSSHSNTAAETIYLNIRPGLLTVDEALTAILTAVNVEHAVGMRSDGRPVPAQAGYRRVLGANVMFEQVERFAFYDLARAADTAIVVATGDQRLYANLLLTIGIAGNHRDGTDQ